jgi:hypothetical protein
VHDLYFHFIRGFRNQKLCYCLILRCEVQSCVRVFMEQSGATVGFIFGVVREIPSNASKKKKSIKNSSSHRLVCKNIRAQVSPSPLVCACGISFIWKPDHLWFHGRDGCHTHLSGGEPSWAWVAHSHSFSPHFPYLKTKQQFSWIKELGACMHRGLSVLNEFPLPWQLFGCWSVQ